MKMSNSIKELASALTKAQSQFGSAKKNAYNPFHKSYYSDLNDVNDVIKKPLSDNGLAYSQFPICENGCYGVETILMHSSGEWMCEKLLLEPSKPGPQASGSAISYARRYALQGILGIPSEDDDANSATQNKQHSQKSSQNKSSAPIPKDGGTHKYLPPSKEWVSKCTSVQELSSAFNSLPNKLSEIGEIIKSRIDSLVQINKK